MAEAEKGRGRRVLLAALAALSAAVLVAGLALTSIVTRPVSEPVPHLAYYRAVYVLQRLVPAAALEGVVFPARAARGDAVESLLHHPDTFLVLRKVAADLASFAGVVPEAPLFEAYARRALGDPRAAAALLTQYVFEAVYQARHYEFLCEALLEEADHASLLLICGEWRERDPACLPQRALFAWAARFGLKRYGEAARAMRRAVACVGWEGKVYAARALVADGREEEAAALLQEVWRDFPGQAEAARRLWDRIALQPLRL